MVLSRCHTWCFENVWNTSMNTHITTQCVLWFWQPMRNSLLSIWMCCSGSVDKCSTSITGSLFAEWPIQGAQSPQAINKLLNEYYIMKTLHYFSISLVNKCCFVISFITWYTLGVTYVLVWLPCYYTIRLVFFTLSRWFFYLCTHRKLNNRQ